MFGKRNANKAGKHSAKNCGSANRNVESASESKASCSSKGEKCSAKKSSSK